MNCLNRNPVWPISTKQSFERFVRTYNCMHFGILGEWMNMHKSIRFLLTISNRRYQAVSIDTGGKLCTPGRRGVCSQRNLPRGTYAYWVLQHTSRYPVGENTSIIYCVVTHHISSHRTGKISTNQIGNPSRDSQNIIIIWHNTTRVFM